MFFGQAFFQGGPRQRFQYRQHRQQRQEEDDHRDTHERRRQQSGGFKLGPLLQFLPLLIIIFSSFIMNMGGEV
jgi:hypothetical protein